MADGRMLKRVITRSQKLAAVKTDKARLLWFYMLPYTDVEGRIEADIGDIREDIIRRQRRGYTIDVIVDCLKDLHRVGLIGLYEVGGKHYLYFSRFHDEQKIRRDREAESQIPAPLQEDIGTAPRKVKLSPSLSEDKLSEVKLSLSEGKENLGVDNSSSKGGLGLEKQINTKAVRFVEGLGQRFNTITKDETTTFARIAQHLSDQVRTGQKVLEIFDQALIWAEEAIRARVGNPKGLFVQKVKDCTGFKAAEKLLKGKDRRGDD